MPNWKKVIVSGSNISQLNNDGVYLRNTGDGILSSSAQIATEISGAFTATSASLSNRIDNITGTFASTGSNSFKGVQTFSGSLLPETTEVFGLGSADYIWAELYVNGNSIYMRDVATNTFVTMSANNGLLIFENAVVSGSFRGTLIANNGILSSSAQISAYNKFLEITGDGVISSSAQIASDISGAFIAPSGGFSSRITSLENAGGSSFSSSIAGRVTTLEGATSTYALKTDITGAFAASSSSFSTRLTSVEGYTLDSVTDNGSTTTNGITIGGLTVNGDATITGTITAQQFNTEYVSSSIIFASGSTKFGDTSDDIHSFTGSVKLNTQTAATTDTDKFLVFDTDGQIKYRTGAEVLSDIGAATGGSTFSASIQERVTYNEIDITALQTTSSQLVYSLDWSATDPFSIEWDRFDGSNGGFVQNSNLKTIVYDVTSSVKSLNAATSSYALKTDISGAFVAPSSSFSTRVTTLENASGNYLQATGDGVISSSAQVDHDTTTNFVANEHIDHTTVSISAGLGMSGGGTIAANRTITLDTSSAHFQSGVKEKMNYDGVISSSAQLTTEFDTRYLNTVGDGVISSSAQLTTEFDTRYLNTTGDGVISSSAQIATEISGAFGATSGAFSTRITSLEGAGYVNASTAGGTQGSGSRLAVWTDTDTIRGYPGITVVGTAATNEAGLYFSSAAPGANGRKTLHGSGGGTGGLFPVLNCGPASDSLGAHFTFTIHTTANRNTAFRAGSILGVWNSSGGNIQYNETSTNTFGTLPAHQVYPYYDSGDGNVYLVLDNNSGTSLYVTVNADVMTI